MNFIHSNKWPNGGEPSVTLTASLTGEWSTDSTKCVNQSNSNTNNKIARVSFAHSKVLQEVIHTIVFTYSHLINPKYCYRKHCVLSRCAIMMFFKLKKHASCIASAIPLLGLFHWYFRVCRVRPCWFVFISPVFKCAGCAESHLRWNQPPPSGLPWHQMGQECYS